MLVKLLKGGEGKKDRDRLRTLKKLIEMSGIKKRTRKDTKLESERAEFLVLGRLLLEKITAFKTYTNFPGYDLIAPNISTNTGKKPISDQLG